MLILFATLACSTPEPTPTVTPDAVPAPADDAVAAPEAAPAPAEEGSAIAMTTLPDTIKKKLFQYYKTALWLSVE